MRNLKKTYEIIVTGIPVVSLVILTLLVLVEVIARYIFKSMPIGIEELALFFSVWLFFIGAVLASKDEEHITVDFLEVFNMPEKILKKIKILANIITLVCLLFFLYYSIEYSIWVNSTNINISPFGWPFLFAISSMTIGLFLMTLYALRRIKPK